MINDVIGVLGLIGGVVAFVVGLREYREAQRWKRAEWLAKLIDDFEHDPKIGLTLQVLDWCERRIDHLYWNEQIIRDSLVVHTDVPDGFRFSSDGAMIRENLDAFLAFMVRLQGYIEDGLIDEGPAMRYFGYWLNRLAWMDQYNDLKGSMQRYVAAYSDADSISKLCMVADQYERARLIGKGHQLGGTHAVNPATQKLQGAQH